MNDSRAQSLMRWKLVSLALAFIGLFIVFLQPQTVKAASILDVDKVTILSKNKNFKIDTKYDFLPEFIPGTSKLTMIQPSGGQQFRSTTYDDRRGAGGGYFNTQSLDVGADNYAKVHSDLNSGKYGARYSRVGYIDGNPVDIIITIKRIKTFGLPGTKHRANLNNDTYGPLTNLSFRTDQIGFVTQGLDYVDLEFKTVATGTTTPVNTSGYYTFNDVDMNQYVGFSDRTWNTDIDDILVDDTSNVLKYWRPSGYHELGSDSTYDIDDSKYDHRYAFTILYSDTPTLNIRWGARFSNRVKQDAKWKRFGNTRKYYQTRYSTGDLLMYTAIKPKPTEIPNPTKTQWNSGSIEHEGSQQYTISQKVPNEHSRFWYKSFELRDAMDDVFKVGKVSIFDDRGTNVTSNFTITTSNNLVRAVAKNTQTRSFYGKTYSMIIDARLDGNRVSEKFGDDQNYVIRNVGFSRIDGRDRDSNEVRNTIGKRSIEVRHVDEKGKLLESQSLNKMIGLPYSVSPKTNLVNSKGHSYRHIKTSGQTSGIVSGNTTITFTYDEPREIIVEHRTEVKDGDQLLERESSQWKYDEIPGSPSRVTGYSKPNHFKDFEGYYFKPLDGNKTITVKGPSTITLRYATPRTITVDHYDKDDNRVLRTTYIKGIYDGDRYLARPLYNTLKDVDNYLYRPQHFRQNSNPNGVPGTVHFDGLVRIPYERPRIIELLHTDNDTEKNIRTDIYHKRIYDTDPYEISSYADEELTYLHKANDTKYFYYPIGKDMRGDRNYLTGEVVEEEVDIPTNKFTLEFFYTKPALDLGLTYIRIDTNKAVDPADVEMAFNSYILDEKRWRGYDVTLTIYDRDNGVQVYQDKKLSVKDLDKGIKIKAITDHLLKGSNAIYDAVITTNNKKEVVSGYATQASIDTNAYAASERTIKGESVYDSDMTFKYKGVAMTERDIRSDKHAAIKEHYEYMSGTVQPSVDMISGYGYELAQVVTFETEVKEHQVPDVKAKVVGHENILDGVYDKVDGLNSFDLEYKDSAVDSKWKLDRQFIMPKVEINRKDGVIVPEDKRGSYTSTDLIDGGRKGYVPIWVNKLGTYNYNVTTTRMGRNEVNFDLDQKINVDAHMFGHIDSETLNDDALLIEPSNKSILDKIFGGR